MSRTYDVISENNGGLIKAWVQGVELDDGAKKQLLNTASLPFIHKWLAVMPDVHFGLGATIGSVIPTINAVIPAAVGVDIGCGMMAVKTSLKSNDLPDSLAEMRFNIERAIPHGSGKARRGSRDKGTWHYAPDPQEKAWQILKSGYDDILSKYPKLSRKENQMNQLGTLGGGNHFVEVCLDENDGVWFMLHSGSRGIGNRIGTYFVQLAKKDMERQMKNLPDKNLAYFEEGSDYFKDYVQAVSWAQNYAKINRDIMMDALIVAVSQTKKIPAFTCKKEAINCHHNYISLEHHFGKDVYVTRKGAVKAGLGDMGIIPGSMGAKSFIVRGKGNKDSFCSCSHGAGRVMSRTQAKKLISLEQHEIDTMGVECKKDASVLDESPKAYKDIDKVMEAQEELVEIVYTLKQIVCVKG
ncbi:MAG: RNA-splicing ligase RtcB [Candidatus Cloacimonadota bacterium]|nr:MAG: RNA-splicing ligase RtcB [Candidatus Cloacimonadota bacterium]